MAKAVQDDHARSLFRRLITMGRAIEESMKVIAFWIWLQSRGFEEIVEKISSRSDEFLAMVSNEAEAVLSSTLMVNSKKSVSPNLMPLTLTLARRFLSPTVILGDREKVMKGIADIYAEFCSVNHFQDIVKEREEKTQHSYSPLLPTAQSKLNPSAKEWNPMKERAPEEYRCLFLTFSNGYPLTESQIIKFFTWKYGECVERVYVHWPDSRNGKKLPPLFGKVVFKASYVPALILCGRKEAKFWVDKKPLWCKRFDPEKKTRKNY